MEADKTRSADEQVAHNIREGLRMMQEAAESYGEKVWKLVETLLDPTWPEEVYFERGTIEAAKKAQQFVYEQVEASFG